MSHLFAFPGQFRQISENTWRPQTQPTGASRIRIARLIVDIPNMLASEPLSALPGQGRQAKPVTGETAVKACRLSLGSVN